MSSLVSQSSNSDCSFQYGNRHIPILIRELERVHFAPDTEQANGHGDLQAIARNWIGKVS